MSNKYLMAAYIVTWVIHNGYILYLGARTRRVAEELKELESTSQHRSSESR
jgi:CcmD family protein